jgi:hypothetical protein
MEEVVNRVADRAGISRDQAQKAVETVSNFIKEKAPAIGSQLDNLMKGGGSSSFGDLANKVGGMMGR